MSAPKCPSIWGHRFEPRYSFAWPKGMDRISTPRAEFHGADKEYVETMLRADQEKTYHFDICVRCGAVVKPQ